MGRKIRTGALLILVLAMIYTQQAVIYAQNEAEKNMKKTIESENSDGTNGEDKEPEKPGEEEGDKEQEKPGGEDEDKDNYLNNISTPNAETLKDVLMQQLLSNSYSKEEDRVFEYIADNLDTSGFLKLSVAEMAEQLGSKEEIVRNCLDIMKELEPVGVCAYDVKECLCLQLKKNYEDCEVELAIIQNGMELLGKKQLQTLAKIIHVPVDRIKLARDRICTLNPKPAQGYSTGEMTQYIVPDAVVVKFKDYFEILLNDYSCPSFHISKEYMQMLKTEPTFLKR